MDKEWYEGGCCLTGNIKVIIAFVVFYSDTYHEGTHSVDSVGSVCSSVGIPEHCIS